MKWFSLRGNGLNHSVMKGALRGCVATNSLHVDVVLGSFAFTVHFFVPFSTMMLSSLHKTGSRLALRSSSSRVISRGFAKEIKFGVEGRAAMLRGVDTLADAVQVSLDSVDPGVRPFCERFRFLWVQL